MNKECLYQTFRQSKRPGMMYWWVKRLMDICISLVALIVCMPFFVIICILIVLDDPMGSPIYRQTRVGKDGKPFVMYKFRSMVVDADAQLGKLQHKNEKTGPVFKIRDDPRITRVGRILRKFSLDELPQFWNVLKGEMSLVGPRPALPAEVKQYTPYQGIRLSVPQGLTCYWQTQNKRDQISFEEWMDLDVAYVIDQSLKTDIRLLIRTIGTILTGQGE